MCAAYSTFQMFTQVLLVWPLESFGSWEGHPQRTLLVPTKGPGFRGAHGGDIQESILESCHSPGHQHSLSAYTVLGKCQALDIQTSPLLT